MKEIKYSIIIPHKNCPDLLQRCVNSIPDSKNIQIIIVDDNSDENKKPIVNREGLEVVLLEEGHSNGAGHARNVGLDKALGKWLVFADSDDFFSDEMLNAINQFYESDYDVVYFKSLGCDSETLKPVKRGNNYGTQVENFLKHRFGAERILRYSHVVPWGKMIRRDFVVLNNIRFEEVRYSNDLMFCCKVGFFAKKINASNVVLYYVTERTGSLVKQINKESIECRFRVNVRRNKFFWDNREWCALRPFHVILSNVWRSYGVKEFLKYFRITNEYGLGVRHVITFEIIDYWFKLVTIICLSFQRIFSSRNEQGQNPR